MKILYLLRHGKAEVGSALQSDRKRELVDRGRKESRKVGKIFLQEGWAVELIVTSPALRAKQTAHIFAQNIGFPLERIREDDFLYQADAAGLLLYLQNLPEDFSSILLVGHNPTFEDLAELLAPSFHQHLPTGSLVAIRFSVSHWRDIKTKKGELYGEIFPKIKNSKIKKSKQQEELEQVINRSIEQTLLKHSFPLDEEARSVIYKQSEKLVKKLLKI